MSILLGSYKSPFAPRWSGYKLSAMSAHSSNPRLSSGAECVASASDIEASNLVQNAPSIPIEEFVNKHLTDQPKGYKHDRSRWKTKKVPLITQCKSASHEKCLYKPIRDLLNMISARAFKYYQGQNDKLRINDQIHFLDHHHSPPAHCALNGKPDLIAVSASLEMLESYKKNTEGVYYGVPIYEVISTVEIKPDTVIGDPQAIRYTKQLLEARPDMPGVYGLCANAEAYSIIWSDPSGPVSSSPIQWDNIKPLEAYVRSLYAPPTSKGHHLWDPTITSPTLRDSVESDKTEGKAQVTCWTIDYGDKTYEDCEQIHTGDCWGRRTTVFEYNDDSGNFAIIKDAYRDDSRRFEEAALLKHIHGEGIFPGVVRLMDSGEVEGDNGSPITTARPASRPAGGEKVTRRTKKRLIMGSRGKRLCAAKSVKDLLMTVYDGVEVHRALVTRKKYLHRDVSFYNFFMYPEHRGDTLAEAKLIKDPPVFINSILEKTNGNDDNCCALFIDADNSALLDPPDGTTLKYVNVELTARTGTPRYIARAVAKGALVDATECRNFYPMPQLTEEAKKVYVKAYGQDTYDKYTDTAAGTAHGRKLPNPDHDAPHFFHRPDHDVESIFWVLIFSIITAKPKDSDDEPSSEFAQALKIFQDHTIQKDLLADPRNTFFSASRKDWLKMLHPGLSSIVTMVQRLAEQVRPEYGLLDPPPKPDHLHEAFRRILLEQILFMEDDIPLTPNISRELPAEKQVKPLPSKKRKAEDDDDTSNRPKKSVRSTNGVHASSWHTSVHHMNDE